MRPVCSGEDRATLATVVYGVGEPGAVGGKGCSEGVGPGSLPLRRRADALGFGAVGTTAYYLPLALRLALPEEPLPVRARHRVLNPWTGDPDPSGIRTIERDAPEFASHWSGFNASRDVP